MAIPKITYGTGAYKANRFAIINRNKQVTAEDMNELMDVINAMVDVVNNSSRSATININTGTTHVTFAPAFDFNVVTEIKIPNPYVRRISDNAVVDFVISNIDTMGFDITVWDDGIAATYVAVPTAWGVTGTGDVELPEMNSVGFRAGLTALSAGVNVVTFSPTVDSDFDDTNYNINGIAYDADGEVGFEIDWSSLTVSGFSVKVNSACNFRWNILKHT